MHIYNRKLRAGVTCASTCGKLKEGGRSGVYIALLIDEITAVPNVLVREPEGKIATWEI